eukprot:9182021-Pyramimonas_sp.AAC.1
MAAQDGGGEEEFGHRGAGRQLCHHCYHRALGPLRLLQHPEVCAVPAHRQPGAARAGSGVDLEGIKRGSVRGSVGGPSLLH